MWRLEYVYPEQAVRVIGTGFVVRDRAGYDYLLTCAHFTEGRPGQAHGSLRMRTMDGARVIESLAAWIHVGTAVDVKRPASDAWPDMTHDFAVRLVSARGARPLPLAEAEPAVGDWVWVVGCVVGQAPGNERLYAGQVVAVANGGYLLKQLEPFDARGFSGGPVVNSRGEVVGNVLAGVPGFVGGATVGTLRRRLKENSITVD